MPNVAVDSLDAGSPESGVLRRRRVPVAAVAGRVASLDLPLMRTVYASPPTLPAGPGAVLFQGKTRIHPSEPAGVA